MKNEIIQNLLMAQNQMKIFHWQTDSYAQHQAFGSNYKALTKLIDELVEVCMGKHGRPQFDQGLNLPLLDLTSVDVMEYIDSVVQFLISLTNVYDSSSDSDLLNIRDEILAEFNKLKYLLTLN
jgi:hypothetical protein